MCALPTALLFLYQLQVCRTVMNLHTDRRLSSWPSGMVRTTWSWTGSKPWRWQWTSREPPNTIFNSTVSAVKNFRFLGSAVSQDLKWVSSIDSIIKKGQQRMYFLLQQVQPASGAADPVLLCNNPVYCLQIHHCLAWISHHSGQEQTRTAGRTAEKKITGANLTSIQDLYKLRHHKGSCSRGVLHTGSAATSPRMPHHSQV